MKEVFTDCDKFHDSLKKATTFGIWRPEALIETGEPWPVPEENR